MTPGAPVIASRCVRLQGIEIMIGTAQLDLKLRSLLRKRFPRKAAGDLGYDPYDLGALRRNATQVLADTQQAVVPEPAEKCRRILLAMQNSYPTAELANEYFANLELALRHKRELDVAGQIVIGVGPGRCGSSSLSQMLGSIPNSCCTHESPPLIFWRPTIEQVDFHVRRFRLLAKYYSVVSDVSHWWLNAIEQIWERLPEMKVIGLIRQHDECARSFMRIQGFGAGSANPWAPPGDSFWRVGAWDATYPSYPVPDLSKHDPDRVKLEQIRRYVSEYNAQIMTLAQGHPGRVKVVRTEALSLPDVQAEIFSVAGHRGKNANWKLNVKGTDDGKINQVEI